MAALRMSEVERQALAAALAAGEAEGVDYAEANARFHELIQDGAHNSVLAATIGDLSLRTMPWRGAQFRVRASRIAESRREHRAILEAILSRDSVGAAALMRAQIGASVVGIVEMVGHRAGTARRAGDAGRSTRADGRGKSSAKLPRAPGQGAASL